MLLFSKFDTYNIKIVGNIKIVLSQHNLTVKSLHGVKKSFDIMYIAY